MFTSESLKNYSLEQVQRFFEAGYISADLYEEYCYNWRNSCFRFSSECEGYQEPEYTLRKNAGEFAQNGG